MQRDEIYLFDLWRIFVREWKWLAAVPAVALLCAFAFTHAVKRQWEATAWIRIGQVGQVPQGEDQKVEPLARILERLHTRPFENDVMKSLGFAPESPQAKLYRKSLKLEPLPYAGPLIRLSVRGNSPQQARQFVTATVAGLQEVDQRLEAVPLAQARARLAGIESDLRGAEAERDRLQRAIAPQNRATADNKDFSNLLLANVMLANKGTEIRGLRQARGDLVDRLSPAYTYQTSLLWPIYVPDKPAYPNIALIWMIGIVLGALLGAFAAIARNALRRRVAWRGDAVPVTES